MVDPFEASVRVLGTGLCSSADSRRSTMIADTLILLADNGHMDWDGAWWLVMVPGMILFWGLLIFGAVWLVRELTRWRGAHRTDAGSEAIAILDRRLASGQISPEEYRERRAMLRSDADPPPDAG
jgi:uncharacterized membrane protein